MAERGKRIDVDEVRTVVAANLPGHLAGAVVPLGEGLDNVAFEVDGGLIVRFAKEPDPGRRAALVEHEARLLATVAELSPLPVPEPAFTVPELGCLAYVKLDGVPLLDVPGPDRSAGAAAVGATLGGFLAALHAVPVERMAELVGEDDQPLAAWRDEAAAIYATIAGDVPPASRPAVRTFLAAPPPDGRHAPVFSHNDLGIEHVLVDPDTLAVTGIIDWSDAAIVDPAYDVGLAYRDLGPAALDALLQGYPPAAADGGLRERAEFYARCGVVEDLAYGIEEGKRAYLDKGLAALAWLFPA